MTPRNLTNVICCTCDHSNTSGIRTTVARSSVALGVTHRPDPYYHHPWVNFIQSSMHWTRCTAVALRKKFWGQTGQYGLSSKIFPESYSSAPVCQQKNFRRATVLQLALDVFLSSRIITTPSKFCSGGICFVELH